jgi:hypothetical protein
MSNVGLGIFSAATGGAYIGAMSPWAAAHPNAAPFIGAAIGAASATIGSLAHYIGKDSGKKEALNALDNAIAIRNKHRRIQASANEIARKASLNPKLADYADGTKSYADEMARQSGIKTAKALKESGPLTEDIYKKISR